MSEKPRLLIEDWLPIKELGIESLRERAVTSSIPPLSFLHVWWARRPLAASAGAVLGSVMPTWTPDLADSFPGVAEVASEEAYRAWFLRLCGVLGDPVAAKVRIADATERGITLGAAAYGYKQAFKNSPTTRDLSLLHDVLVRTWGTLPAVIDPTAGGGSIPYEAIRYGLPTTANDLNPIPASLLRAGVAIPAQYGVGLARDIERIGGELVRRVRERLEPFFPIPDRSDNNSFIFARSVTCPRSGKPVPLAPNWWLSREKGGVAVRLVTERVGRALDEPAFEIVRGKEIDFDPNAGTVSGGDAISPWDGLAIPGEYIKQEAQAGRMGSILYAVAIRVAGKRDFRAPTPTDLAAIAAAERELARLLPEWEANDVIPMETIPDGSKTSEPHRYGMRSWRDMFSPRQLLVHGTFVEEYRKLLRAAAVDDRQRAAFALFALAGGKAINWNSLMSSWNVNNKSMRSVFDRHDFAFKWTYAEFEGAREIYSWSLKSVKEAYKGIADLLLPSDVSNPNATHLAHAVPGTIVTMQGSATHMPTVETDSQVAIVIDPPYFDNVQYSELSDYFYVWEKSTLGLVWPEFFQEELTDKKNEAVANPSRFKDAGKRKNELANSDYEIKMQHIFEECHRILRADGVMTVMFTHKNASAWDSLGSALIQAGFTIETSWPVPTESPHSMHQAQKNAAQSTIFLACRKRPAREVGEVVLFADVEPVVRRVTREVVERFSGAGVEGVDLLLSTYGPALGVISGCWPVLSDEVDPVTGNNRLLKPEEALAVARDELARIQRQRITGRSTVLDAMTDFAVLGWDMFRAREFPFDDARRLALAVGLEVEVLTRAKVITKKSGTVSFLTPRERVLKPGDKGAYGVRFDGTPFATYLDAVHTALYLTGQDGAVAARTFLERYDLLRDERFLVALQAFLNVVPRGKKDGKFFLPEAAALEELASLIDGVTIPAAAHDSASALKQGELF